MRPRDTVIVDGHTYVPIWWMEWMHDRKHRTIRTWVDRQMLNAVTINGIIYVHYRDALRLHAKREQRAPRPRKKTA